MGDWSLLEGQLVDTVGEDTATSMGTHLYGDATAHTKGPWIQIIASTTYAADGLSIFLQNGYWSYLVDVGIGPSGSETVIINNLLVTLYTCRAFNVYSFPIAIPAGTRIAARAQGSGGAWQGIEIAISLISQGFLPSSSLQRITTYGANTGDTGGVSVDAGATAHTKGAYSQINAATAAPIRGLLVAVGTQDNLDRADPFWLVDIAVGAAGSERIVVPDIAIAVAAWTGTIDPCVIGPFFIDIPAGTRLAARAQCSINDATDRIFDVVLYGVD